jgi:hypothetical protein
MHTQGMRHDNVYVSFCGKRHPIPPAELTGGKAIYVYGSKAAMTSLAENYVGLPIDIAFWQWITQQVTVDKYSKRRS